MVTAMPPATPPSHLFAVSTAICRLGSIVVGGGGFGFVLVLLKLPTATSLTHPPMGKARPLCSGCEVAIGREAKYLNVIAAHEHGVIVG